MILLRLIWYWITSKDAFMHKVEIYRSRSGKQPWRWRVRARNGRIICQGEGHPTKAKALRAAVGVVRVTAQFVDVEEKK